jgi:TM2 domain-containing membrane protein YozV
MKKVVLFLSVLILSIGLTKASSFKLDAATMETKFSTAQEISIEQLNFMALTQNAHLTGDKSRVKAGLLGIFCGGLGIHRFYLGHKSSGVIYLVVGILSGTSLSGLLGVIDGVLYLVASDEEFQQKYANNDELIQWL